MVPVFTVFSSVFPVGPHALRQWSQNGSPLLAVCMDPIVQSFITKHLNELPTLYIEILHKISDFYCLWKEVRKPTKANVGKKQWLIKDKKTVPPKPGLLLPSESRTSLGPNPSPWVPQAAWLFVLCMPGVKCVPFVSTLRKVFATLHFLHLFYSFS